MNDEGGNNVSKQQPNHLAWHETLEMHELVAFQAIGLMKIKQAYAKVTDPKLKMLYKEGILGLSKNIKELLPFYSMAPRHVEGVQNKHDSQLPFYAGDLLALFKTGVRNYAIAITETASAPLRDTLKKQLNRAIDMHAKIFNYMYENSYYPSYDLEKILENDVRLANRALDQSY
ncbi:spore coat protein [Amphibacillus sediminis]|uniref:spore coat protein n=1 Tax=Amphibacillus sediminis TaxID=360185 RepID=UPI00082E210F|nr:spore coat protein [Amphibacillus sediminis]